MNWKVFVISAVLVLAAGGIGGYFALQPKGVSQELVQELPAQSVLTYIKGLKSPLVLVNFWASWCEPCKVEFPNILKIRERFGKDGLQVVFVSIDEPTDLEAAQKFLREQHVDFPTFYKGSQSVQFVTDIYPKWSGSVPTTILIGGDGQIKDAWEGDTTLEEFEQRVTRQLKPAGT
jgi:thiol-disulfide isomerase/thioredoxin